MSGYTCLYCAKWYQRGDPGIEDWTAGWFVRCSDRKNCARRLRNRRNGVHPESMSLMDELLISHRAQLGRTATATAFAYSEPDFA